MSHYVDAADPSPLEEQLVINCRAIPTDYHVCLLVCLLLKTFGEYIGFALVSNQHESAALNTTLLAHNFIAQKPGMV